MGSARAARNLDMTSNDHQEAAAASDRPEAETAVLIPSIAIAGLFATAFLASPEETGAWAQSVMAAIGTNFSWLYLAFGMAALGFCLWLALGPHGRIKLGGADEPVEFSTPHWVAMMFTAGIGAGTVAWGFGEPLYYLETPPLGDILRESGLYAVTATIAGHLPFGNLSLVFFIVLCIVFYATTMDSAAFVAACVCSKNLRASQEPLLPMRFAWISVLFLMTLGVTHSGSLSAVQSLTVIGSLPVIPILIVMSVSLVRRLNARRED